MTDASEKPVRLPARSRQGMLLSLDGVQVATLLVAVGILWVAVASPLGPLGLLVAAPVAVPVALAAVFRLHGFPVPTMIGLWLMNRADDDPRSQGAVRGHRDSTSCSLRCRLRELPHGAR